MVRDAIKGEHSHLQRAVVQFFLFYGISDRFLHHFCQTGTYALRAFPPTLFAEKKQNLVNPRFETRHQDIHMKQYTSESR